MQVLLANLRHLYQRRYLWFAYLFCTVLMLPGPLVHDSREELVFVWLMALLSGILVGGTSKDVINKPFVRCLPGHPQAVRRVVFLVGLTVSVLAGALFVRHGGSAARGSPTVFCAAVCASMAVYLGIVTCILFSRPMTGPSGSITFFFLFATFIACFPLVPRLRSALEATIIRRPLWMIAGGGLVGLGVWFQMSRREWSRQLSSLGLHFGTAGKEREKHVALARWHARGACASVVATCFFLGRMRGCRDYSAGRYIWGTLYATFGALAVWWKWLAFASIGVAIVSLYTGLGAAYLLLWVSWGFVPHFLPPLHSTVLVPAGRRERFLSVLFLAVVVAGIVSLWAFVVSLISLPLSRLVPQLEIWGIPFVCRRVPLGIVSVPLFTVPLFATLSVLFPSRLHGIVSIAVSAIMMIVTPWLVVIAFAMWFWMSSHGVELVGGPGLWIAMGVIIAWTLFALMCKHKIGRRSLAGR